MYSIGTGGALTEGERLSVCRGDAAILGGGQYHRHGCVCGEPGSNNISGFGIASNTGIIDATERVTHTERDRGDGDWRWTTAGDYLLAIPPMAGYPT